MDSQVSEVGKLGSVINQITKTEFFFEQLSASYLTKHFGPNFLLECLGAFEIGLLFFRLKKFFAAPSRLYHSEAHVDERLEGNKEQLKNTFSYKQMKVTATPEEIQDLKKQIKELLGKIRDAKPFSGFNYGFKDQLNRSEKQFGLIRKLPADIEEENKIESKNFAPYRVGELLHLIRPVVYCFAQIFFGQKSYKPYFISLAIDIIRLILQSRLKFTSLSDLQEFKKRNKDIIINYLLRNPVYTEIVRNRILDPLLDRLFPRLTFIKKIIIYIIEIRSSLSLLM